MVDATAALMFAGVFTLTLLPLVMVYRMPEHNALDEAVARTRERGESETMNLFQQAQAGLNLTPGQRAFLKLLQGFALAGVQSLVIAAPSVIALNEGQVALAAGGFGVMIGAFVHGFLAAWQKYASAKGDAPLAAAIGTVDSAVEKLYPEIPAGEGIPPTPPDDGAPAQAQQAA